MSPAGGATDEFAVRYYRWALQDAAREVGQGFPLLRAVRSSLAIRAVAYIESFPAERRPQVAAALVKRFHRRAVDLAGEPWGPEDERIARGYLEAARTPAPEETWHRHAELKDPAAPSVDRERLLSTVRAALAPIVGSGEAFSTTHDWRFVSPLGAWTLVTVVDVGGRRHQLTYTQTIRADTAARPLKEGISICGWLGIGGQTAWEQLAEADTTLAARFLARICAHFLRAAPALLAGLRPE